MKKSFELSPMDIARYVDPDVSDQVSQFHAKSNYTLIPGVAPRTYLSEADQNALSDMVQSEISLWPGLSTNASLKSDRSQSDSQLLRNESGVGFDDSNELSFSIIDQLLVDSFCARSDDSRKRPYPSGGALYPIEVFLCRLSGSVTDWPCPENILHLLPLSKGFEAMYNPPTEKLVRALSGGDEEKLLGRPHFALVYSVFFERAIFKYRYRGYRLALMEAGSMYQIADLNAKKLGLKNRMWAGFTDFQVAKLMGIDMRYIAPLVVQFFGHTEVANA